VYQNIKKWKRWLHCFHFAQDAVTQIVDFLRQNHRLVESQIANSLRTLTWPDSLLRGQTGSRNWV
jgi:hypothetical protein